MKKPNFKFLSEESDKPEDEIGIRCHELDRIAEFFAGLFSFAQALPFCTVLRLRHAKLIGESLDRKSAEKLAAIILRIHEAKWDMLNDDELAEISQILKSSIARLESRRSTKAAAA